MCQSVGRVCGSVDAARVHGPCLQQPFYAREVTAAAVAVIFSVRRCDQVAVGAFTLPFGRRSKAHGGQRERERQHAGVGTQGGQTAAAMVRRCHGGGGGGWCVLRGARFVRYKLDHRNGRPFSRTPLPGGYAARGQALLR